MTAMLNPPPRPTPPHSTEADPLADLKRLSQWVCWRWVGAVNPTTGKRDKLPINSHTGKAAESNNSATWASYDQASAAYRRYDHAGVGFVFSADDPFCGIDLDKCIDAEMMIDAAAWDVVEAVASYAEISPSGNGIKIFCRARIARALKLKDIGGGVGLEVYDRGRFFTVTERYIDDIPPRINLAQPAIDALIARYAPQPAPRPAAPSRPQQERQPTSDAYPAAWCLAILRRVCATAADTIATAGAGYRHHARVKAGTLLGGYLGGLADVGQGHLMSDEEAAQFLYDACPPETSAAKEIATIRGTIAAGREIPITIDAPPAPEPARAAPTPPAPPAVPAVALASIPESPDDDFIRTCLYEDESGDARLFAALYAGRLAYDHAAGQWFIWAGHAWNEDGAGIIRPLIEAHLGACYLAYAVRLNTAAATEPDMIKKQRHIVTITMAQKRAALLHTLRRQNTIEDAARYWCSPAQIAWDNEPWLLAVANGVIDLKTGQLSPGCPAQYLRKITPVEWRGIDTPAPRWEQFLTDLFEPGGPNAEIPAYLQRLFGYGAIGIVRHAVLPVLYGPNGRNGKDTMLKTIGAALGPHAGAMGNDVLISTGRGRDAGAASGHLTDLQGKRIVWAAEPDDGQRFSVGQAKLLTGGGEINARAVYGKKNITFKPTHLMLLLTNHKPKAPADDSAFWSRMQLIPFLYRYLEPHEYTGAPNERLGDPTLDAKLISELSGILAWIVRGCLEYQRLGGIHPPAVVQAATAEYRSDEDTFGDYLESCCYEGPQATGPAGLMYKRYQAWAIDNGYKFPMTNKRFSERMKERFEQRKTMAGLVYAGVGLLTVMVE